MTARIKEEFVHLDLLILNASGGLERDKPADYATQLNVTAQVRAVDLALPLMREGGRIIFFEGTYTLEFSGNPIAPNTSPKRPVNSPTTSSTSVKRTSWIDRPSSREPPVSVATVRMRCRACNVR